MDDAQQAIELALAQAKRVQRESRISVQQLARLRDYLQSEDIRDAHTEDSST